MRVIVIHADGAVDAPIEVAVSDGEAVLGLLQKAVGGYIEAVPFWDRYEGEQSVAFCNEEGKLETMPLNAKATDLWYAILNGKGFVVKDYLVGDIAVVVGTHAELRKL